MEIKNLTKTAKRIQRAIKAGEKIILYGDADLDGVASVIILKETIKKLGYSVCAIYFPDREKEGYGISEIGLNFLKKFSPALFIATDLGITNFKEVRLAKKLGFEVLIIDHHEVLDELPEAKIIVNPKQSGDEYEFKGLATAGIIFKLSQILLGEKISEGLRKNFLELTAIATIADMMPKEKENKRFIEEGKLSLENSQRLGIMAFFEFDELEKLVGLEQKISRFNSILNVREVESQFPVSYRLLTVSSIKKAREIIEKLLVKNKLRREKIEQMLKMVEKEISAREPIIFAGGPNFEFNLISVVASRICQKHKKPTFIYKKLQNEATGTVRVPSGVNSVLLMKKCSRELLTFGGHSAASGFRIKNENIEKFKTCLIKNLKHDPNYKLHSNDPNKFIHKFGCHL